MNLDLSDPTVFEAVKQSYLNRFDDVHGATYEEARWFVDDILSFLAETDQESLTAMEDD